MIALLCWVLLCHSIADPKHLVSYLKTFSRTYLFHKTSPYILFFLPFDDTINLSFIWYLKNFCVGMHLVGFIGGNFRGTHQGVLWLGGFKERGFSEYQFSEWRSAFIKHMGIMTEVILHTVFDKYKVLREF